MLNKQQQEKALQKKQKTLTMGICPEIKSLKFNSETKEIWQEKINQIKDKKDHLIKTTPNKKSLMTDIRTPKMHKIAEEEKRKWKKARSSWKPKLQSESSVILN